MIMLENRTHVNGYKAPAHVGLMGHTSGFILPDLWITSAEATFERVNCSLRLETTVKRDLD